MNNKKNNADLLDHLICKADYILHSLKPTYF